MNKKILYGLILLLTLSLTLGAVSANDDFSNETLGVSLSAPVNDIELSTNNEEASAKNSDALLGSSNENALGAGEGTFTELQTLVSRGGTITLDKDYIFTGGFTNGITITSAGTVLDGNGHTIDGKGLSRIFTISGNSVTLKNLNIINGYHTTTAGAASISGSNVIIDNCTFANSSSTGRFGGAVSWSGPNGILRNSNFISNHAYTRGGAIHWLGDKGTLQNLLIINNTADNVAGGLYISDESPQRTSTVGYNLTFIGNTAYSGGGAVIAGKNSKISYSTFKNNHAYYGGGAIIEEDLGGTTIIDNCIIVNNTANNYGGGANINFGTISNSIVENNTAYVGGGIYGVKGTVKNVTSINNFAVYGINMAVVSQLTIIASYITETYYFNLTESYSSTTGSNTIITLPNGDYAYCIEKFSSPPAYGYFNPAVDMVKNTATGENVGEYIKILIYENVENKNSALAKSLYEQIWIFVDSDFRSSTDPLVKRAVELYDSGFRVPTKNAIKVLSDGTELVYNFYTIISACARQNLFYFTIDNHGKVNINPELSVQKITLNKTVYSGEQTSFEIFVKNTGNVDLNTVTVTENSYDGLEYDSFKGDLWTHSIVNGKHVYRFNHVLKIGMNASFIVTFNTNRTGNFTNVVVAKSDKTTDKPADNTTEVILNKTNPGMDVNKVSLTPVVNVGEQTLFLITVWNTGELDLGNVFVEEQIPDGLTFAGFVGDKWSKVGNVFYYNDVLGVGESANFTIVFNTHVNGTFVNCVVAGSNETENKTTNNTTVVKKPGMIVDKKSLTPNVKVGEQTLFLITVKNTGELDLGNVFVEEQIPDGLTYAGFVGDKWSKVGNVFIYNDVLGVGESANFTIVFNTHVNGTFVNCVVAGSNETENKTTNNTTVVKKPGMIVDKKSLTPNVKVGEQTLFLITVKNTGELDLGNVFVEEQIPDGLTYAGFVGDKWTKNGNVFYYNGILGVGESANFTIVFNTHVNGTFVNCVVAGSNETENKTTNNTTVVKKPGMIVDKKSLTPVVKVGEQTLFLITVKNTGELDLGNVFVEEQIPDGLTYAGFVGDKWTKNGNVFYYNGILGIGESANFTIAFNTSMEGKFINCVVAGSNETENKTTNNTTTVYKPGLNVEKITLTPIVMVGNQAIFEIVVRNTGNMTLNNVFIEESYYDGLTFDHAEYQSHWIQSVVNGKNRWTLNTPLVVDEVACLIVVFNTTQKGNFTNVVVSGSDETENKTTNNTTKVVEPKFDVQKITINPVVLVGEQVTFEIVVRNTGTVALNDVFVKELSYEGLTYASFNDNGLWTYNGQGLWILNRALEVNEVVSLFVTFNTTQRGNFTNVVVAGSDETENKTTNNTTTVLEPKLDVQKITITPKVSVGEQVSFEIVVRNTGDVALNDVFVRELSYDGLTYTSFDDNGLWTYNGQNLWKLNKVLNLNEVVTLVVNFNATHIGNFTNVVVAGSDESENKTTNNTTTVVEGKLDVQKITITPVVLVGDQVTFEIVVKNIGEAALTNVFVEESSYDGLNYASYINNGDWTHSFINGKHRWTLNTNLAVNEVVGLFVVFNTTQKGNFTNVVVAGSDKTENKTTNNTTKVVEPKLDVQKITLTPVVHVGNQTSFEIVVRNTGEVALHNVVLEETSYEGLTYASFVQNNNLWSHSVVNGKNIWTLNKVLNVKEVVSLIVNFDTTEVGNFTNIVTVGSTETEDKIANNTTTVYNKTTPVPESNTTKNPNINIEKTALNDVVIVGEQVIFEIIVTNTGEVVLHDVTVTEDSFDGLQYLSFFDNTGLWNNNALTWTLNTPLYVGEMASFYVVFNTTAPGKFINIVSVDSNETDKKSANDTVEAIKPEMDVQKVTINKSVLVGDQVTFEIIVENTGKVTLNNVIVRESSYDSLVYNSFIDHTGLWTKNGDDLSWKLNTPLYAGEYAGFFVVFNTTKTGKFVNVIVAGSDETPNKTDNDTVDVFKGNIDVQKITLTPVVHVGNQTSFEILVKNIGEIPLHNVVLEETSYDGLIYDSFVNNGLWTHSVVNGKNIWTLNRVLNVNEMVTLIVNFNTVTVGNFTNIVTVFSNETGNKVANNTTIVYNNTKPTPEQDPSKNPNINIEKIALHKVVILGNQAIFEIIVTNTGDTVLHDVTVSEDSFTGLTYADWYDNTGLWTKNRDLTWTMNSPLYVGEIASFYVVFDTTTTGEFTNIVSVDSNETDKKSANDTVEVIKPDFAVEKITINRSVLVGEQVMFEILVHNLGQVDLNNVVVRETSYAGLIYDSFIDSAALWTKNSDLSWRLNNPLRVGEYAGFFVVFNTTTTGNFINVVVADSTEIPNKTSNDTVEVLQPNLEVQKITVNRTVYVGEKVMFEIVVHNAGKVVLNDVTIRENSFDGLIYDSFIDNYNLWTKNNDLSWTLNTPLYAGEYLSFYVVFNTNKVGTFTNVVSASSDKTQDKFANNITTVIDRPVPDENKTYTPMADLAIVKVVYAIDGNKVTWGLYVVNNGPDKAVNARVMDVLPETLQYINSFTSKGSYDVNSGVWLIGDMENGEEAVMIIETIALTTGEITNEAIVTSDTIDPNMSNNYDNETVVVSDVPETPQQPAKANVEPVDVTPATGNPLVMVLLALFVVAAGTLRRKK